MIAALRALDREAADRRDGRALDRRISGTRHHG
jgi:hypothetical protein